MNRNAGSSARIAGLDTLRFIAAIWVACSHGARPPLEHALNGLGPLGGIIVALDNGLFNGVASVMTFFVISGLVIHHAHIGSERIDIASHYARRLTRIVPPVGVAFLVYAWLGPRFVAGFEDVLWSIYCEIAFYAVYPLLFPLFRGLGVERVFLFSTIPAACAIALNLQVPYHSELPIAALIAIGAPCLLLGCLLAEKLNERGFEPDPGTDIWSWRAAAVVLSALLKLPVTHGPAHIGYPASHWIFAVFAFFWLGREIAYFASRGAPRWSETGGRMSYSLYLAHNGVITLFALSETATAPLRGMFGGGAMAWLLAWAMMIAMIVVAMGALFIVIEQPCHRYARLLTRARPAWRAGKGWARVSS